MFLNHTFPKIIVPFKDIHFYSMTEVFQSGPREEKKKTTRELDRKRILIQMVFLGAIILKLVTIHHIGKKEKTETTLRP